MANGLSTSMLAALVYIHRAKRAHVGLAFPGEIVNFYDNHSLDLQGRSLVALWRRGLLTFDIHARLTPAGEKAIEHDQRTRPGQRNFRIINGGDGSR